MIEIIFIVGPPGSGKTYGLRTLNPKKTGVINSDKKPLTFRGSRQNYVRGGNLFYEVPIQAVSDRIRFLYEKKNKNNAFVYDYGAWDTANSSMIDVEMSHVGTLSFNEWYEFAKDTLRVMLNAKDLITRDKPFYLFIMFHEGEDHLGRRNVLTSGRKLSKIQLEGQVNWCFFTKVSGEPNNPVFELETVSYGNSTAKREADAIPAILPNDYALVIKYIEAYISGEEAPLIEQGKEEEKK